MFMIHKFNIIALVFFLLFSIAGCGSDDKSTAKQENAEISQVAEDKSVADEVKEATEVVKKAETSESHSSEEVEVKEEVSEAVEEKTIEVANTVDTKEKVKEEETVAVDEEKNTLPTETVPAQINPYEGKYDILDEPQPTTTDQSKIEVLEIFSYMCPHCFHFNNYLQEWLKTKPEDVEFVHLPVVYRDSWNATAKAYFAAKGLGVLDKVHNPIFSAIHKEKKPLNSERTLARFFIEHGGVEKEAFSEFYNSFSVDSQIRTANATASKYGVKGVPAIIVNGKYRLSTEKSGGYKQMMKIVDYLVAEERKLMTTDDKKDD